MTTLQFKQPKTLQHSFIILHENKEIGSLAYAGMRHRKAEARMNSHVWSFAQEGLLGRKIEITSQDNEETLSASRVSGLRQVWSVRLNDVTYQFKSYGMGMRSHYAWADESGDKQITYANGGFIKSHGDIEVAEDTLLSSSAQLLIPLGLFLGLNQDENYVSVAAG